MFLPNFQLLLQLNVILLLLLYTRLSCGDTKPDVCMGSSITSIERVTFLDGINRYFISSGNYYWFVNETSDLPNGDNARLIPENFIPDASLIKDTRDCKRGRYELLLIEVNIKLL